MLGRNTYLHHPRSVVDLDGVEIFLHHHQYLHHQHQQQPDAAFSGLYLAANAAAPSGNDNNNTLFSHETGEPSAVGNNATVVAKKQTAKRDRHSKIHTAQGPRDRRVRLSIAIARKFFDLQEMLGFDKPSKTLDWLLTKSRAAIKELVQKHQSSTSSPSACDELASIDNGGGDSKRKLKELQQAAMSLAKESRAKARARARERTLEKMCIKQQLGGEGCSGSDLNPSSSFDQCRNNDQLEFLQLSAAGDGFRDPIYHFTSSKEAAAAAAAQDLIEESIAIKQRKHKNPPNSLLGFQQNLVLNSNYIFPNSSANANQNWDVFGLNSQSHLHAVFDQHKFFNSNANI